MFAKALNRNLSLQLYKVLNIRGNCSSILSRLDHRFQDPEILDPLLYEDAAWMIDLVS